MQTEKINIEEFVDKITSAKTFLVGAINLPFYLDVFLKYADIEVVSFYTMIKNSDAQHAVKLFTSPNFFQVELNTGLEMKCYVADSRVIHMDSEEVYIRLRIVGEVRVLEDSYGNKRHNKKHNRNKV